MLPLASSLEFGGQEDEPPQLVIVGYRRQSVLGDRDRIQISIDDHAASIT